MYPIFLPTLALICSLLLIKNKKTIFLHKISIFTYSFSLLIFAELIMRYTGIYKSLNYIFFLTPIFLATIIYFFLKFRFSRELT